MQVPIITRGRAASVGLPTAIPPTIVGPGFDSSQLVAQTDTTRELVRELAFYLVSRGFADLPSALLAEAMLARAPG